MERRKAHAAQRKQFGVLLGKLRARDTVVVSKLDRLGRDAPDVLSTIKSLTMLGVEVVVLQLGKLDLASTPGKSPLLALTGGAVVTVKASNDLRQQGMPPPSPSGSPGQLSLTPPPSGTWTNSTRRWCGDAPFHFLCSFQIEWCMFPKYNKFQLDC